MSNYIWTFNLKFLNKFLFLDIDNNDGSLQFKRISPNQIQIFQYESMVQKNVFESSVFQETKMIAEFVGINQGSKISWVMNRQ